MLVTEFGPNGAECVLTDDSHPGFFARLTKLWRVGAKSGVATGGQFSASLSGRLLLLTAVFVMFSEILVYLPSVARARIVFLEERINAARIAVLALEAGDEGNVSDQLVRALQETTDVYSISVKISGEMGMRYGYLTKTPPIPTATFDVRESEWTFFGAIREAIGTMMIPDRDILVRGDASALTDVFSHHGNVEMNAAPLIDIVMSEKPLRDYLFTYSRNILLLSVFISLLTASLVYFSLLCFLVRPMQRMSQNMVDFRDHPQDVSRVHVVSTRRDEIGVAQRELASMQRDLQSALQQKTRLAALGTAVSKINHDLRNILASAQLISDRLVESEDPFVKQLAPKLLHSIDRAVSLCSNTLLYGKAEERAPDLGPVKLLDVAQDAAATAGLPGDGGISVLCHIPEDVEIVADSEQIFRVLLNLFRNAGQALSALPEQVDKEIKVVFEKVGDRHVIRVSDTGGGIPAQAKAKLFQPFAVHGQNGTGLGLSIARELIEAHGGTIELVKSDEAGTEFCISLPVRVIRRPNGNGRTRQNSERDS